MELAAITTCCSCVCKKETQKESLYRLCGSPPDSESRLSANIKIVLIVFLLLNLLKGNEMRRRDGACAHRRRGRAPFLMETPHAAGQLNKAVEHSISLSET